jgi:hypothetical protein
VRYPLDSAEGGRCVNSSPEALAGIVALVAWLVVTGLVLIVVALVRRP